MDITKVGLYRYAQSPAFSILLFAYSLDGAPVEVVDLACGQTIPRDIIRHLYHPDTIKHAYNAAFEWYCLSRLFRLEGPAVWLSQWRCTMLRGLYCGYPAGLDATGKALGLPQDRQKLASGKALIRYFCTLCTPTKNNSGRTRNLPHHDPAKWTLFKEYCRQDVVAEMEIERRLSGFPVPEAVQAQWVTDQIINLRGVTVDSEFVAGALEIDRAVREGYIREASELSRLKNPNSVAQLSKWLEEEIGDELPDLKKGTVTKLLSGEINSDAARRMLKIRQELGKTSTKKYNALEVCECADGRIRGLLQFYGANRTGRWAGRLVQVQNLPRTYINNGLLPLARNLVKRRQTDALRLVFGSVPDTLSQLIRTALTASPGHILVDADYSAIEARVVAWLSGEEWVLEVFRTHGRIYEATASQLYSVPLERIKKGNPEYTLRQYGKAATLALGYGGGAQALITAGHLDKETPEDELLDIRDRWRQANSRIVQFWHTAEAAAEEAVNTGRSISIQEGRLVFARECDPANDLDFMTIRLPSGRKLYYPRPHMGVNRFGQPALCHWGINQTTKKWEVVETYGGKLVENITQAVARDCLAEAIERLETAGYPIVFHVHDEVIIDAKEDCLKDVVEIMRRPPAWADGLPLNADGWVGEYYRKD